MRELKEQLHFFQMHVRMDIRSVASGKAKVREIARRMREVQKDGR